MGIENKIKHNKVAKIFVLALLKLSSLLRKIEVLKPQKLKNILITEEFNP